MTHIKFILLTIVSIVAIGLQKSNAQNIDSLLTIWKEPTNEATKRLAAIQQLLSTKSYYTLNLDTAYVLAFAQYDLAKKKGKSVNVSDALTNILHLSFEKEDYLEVIDLGKEYLNDESTYLSTSRRAHIHITIGLSLHEIGKSKQAIIEYAKVIPLENISDTLLSSALNRMGLAHYRLGDYPMAIEAYQKYFEVIKSMPDAICKEAIYYTNISNVYFAMEELATAFKYIELSVEKQKECGNEKGLILKLANIAKIYGKYKDYERALISYNKSLALALKYDNKNLILDNQIEIANIYAKQGLIQKAQNIFFTIENLTKEVENYETVAYYYFSYGQFKRQLKQYEEAYKACEKGYNLCLNSNHLFATKLCAKCLSGISKLQLDTVSALYWSEIATTIEDSIISKKAIKRAAQLEIELKYRDKRINDEKEILSLHRKTAQAERNKIISLLLLFITFIIAFFVYRSEKRKAALLNQQKHTLEKDLENKELIRQESAILRKQEKLKADFFANLSHEFQTPLAIIKGQSNNLLQNSSISQEDKLILSTISRNSISLSNLTAQALEITKSDEWTTELVINQFYLYELLNPIIREYQIVAKEKELQLNCNYNDTQELILITDAHKLKIVITNLLSNAIKYSKKEGFISLTISIKNENLAIEFKDNGVGIPQKELAHIFNRFYQGEASKELAKHQKGYGIGLTVCKEYIASLKGEITVKSIVEEGSVFYIEIPVKIDSSSRSIDNKPLLGSILGNVPVSANISDTFFISESLETILIVENNKHFWLHLQGLFLDNYNLVFKSDGQAALNYLKNSQVPDLIIVDIMTPYIADIPFIKFLQSTPSFNAIPLLVVSAKNDIRKEIKGLNLNIDHYIIKPFERPILLERIAYLLSSSEKNFATKEDTGVKELQIAKKDQVWLDEVESLINASISDPEFTSANITSAMELSQTHLNRKLKALTGFTASKYILEARYKKALELLENKTVTSVKAVCYSVGFKGPKYFARNFKKRFGKYPSEYL